MFGSVMGTILASLYLVAYLAAGLFIANRIFYREGMGMRLLMGAVLGSFSLQWFPAFFSLFMGFTLWSHLVALCLLALLVPLVWKLCPGHGSFDFKNIKWRALTPLVLIFAVFVYFFITLSNHTLVYDGDAMLTGQSTYGDMNMHLGFITSVAKQGTFPPEYSILPGTKLCYPFLCDTISSSLYLFGCSLRFAYMLPMLIAALEVFLGFYLLAANWLKDRSKATLAWVLFFLCGGFGFIYFLDQWRTNPENFLRIFTEFYQTPTNLTTEGNIRWVNVIVDMMIPQRATLFGWAILFPTLTVLYRAVFKGERRYFWIAGILAGGLPMIHTHSFLALGIICACWLLYVLAGCIKETPKYDKIKKASILFVLLCTMMCCILTLYSSGQALQANTEPASMVIALPVLGLVGSLLLVGCCMLLLAIRGGHGKALAKTWGLFFLIAMVLALPQLITWTFAQVGNGTMLRGYFNWANINDNYIWFYVKNIGMVALLAIPALIAKRKTMFKVAAPALLILFICEFVVFQPNVYDNNKLLYVSYALVCCVVASYLVDIYRLLAKAKLDGRKFLAGLTVFLCIFSAVLTMGREIVSSYELYEDDQVLAAQYIELNTPVDAVILTNTRHNNAVSSLTGRNIVCGTSSFLYYHGVDYQGRQQDVERIYNNIANSAALLAQYNVDYIFVGPHERSSYYALDENALSELYPLLYSQGDVNIYAVSKRASEGTWK